MKTILKLRVQWGIHNPQKKKFGHGHHLCGKLLDSCQETSQPINFRETSQTTNFFEKSSKILKGESFKSGSFVSSSQSGSFMRCRWLESRGFPDNQWLWPDFFADYEYPRGTSKATEMPKMIQNSFLQRAHILSSSNSGFSIREFLLD